MQNQVQQPQATTDALMPPPELTKEERWIVRIHGKDMGPFSSQALYPKLLRGEIDPETLLLDQNRFTRCRLSEIDEFQPYLALHNTQNPILLEEQRQQEKEKHWEEKGRQRMIMSIVSAVVLVVAGFLVWRFVIYKPSDVYLSPDGQFAIQLGKFNTHSLSKKQENDWKWTEKRRFRRGGGKANAGSKSSNVASQSFDFTSGDGGGGIPKEKLRGIIARNVSSIYPCFLSQMERDGSFSGGTVVFNINGSSGSLNSVAMEDGGRGVLTRCIRSRSSSWRFPNFQGNAEIYLPITLNRRRRY